LISLTFHKERIKNTICLRANGYVIRSTT
jgi:hypothetical protein